MTDFKTEGQPAFPVEEKGNDIPSESSPENQESSATNPSSGGNPTDPKSGDAGFADHPRWKEREENWTTRYNEQEKRHVSEIQKLREEIIGNKSQPTKPANDEAVEVPEWFGGDEKQYRAYLSHQDQLLEKAEERARAKLAEESTREQVRIDEATKFFEEQLAALEADKDLNPKGENIDKNKLLKFVLDNDLVDSKGRWNYRAGFQIMRSQAGQPKADATKDRKDLAAATISGSSKGGERTADVMTSEDFHKPGKRPW